MKTETIKQITINVLFVVGVILILVGFFQSTKTAVKLITSSEYPLEPWSEQRCFQPQPVETKLLQDENLQTETAQILECKAQIEKERVTKKAEDITASITTLASGLVLALTLRKKAIGQ